MCMCVSVRAHARTVLWSNHSDLFGEFSRFLKAPKLVTVTMGHMAVLMKTAEKTMGMMRVKNTSVEIADVCSKMRPKSQKFGSSVAFVNSGFTFLVKVFHIPPN